ncbi:MAG TPA: DivIVA domain-containing protein [Acidimicrobiia bacterium]|nr:DivIVA domain-containing protein [Acidimicrobiia bacterium]
MNEKRGAMDLTPNDVEQKAFTQALRGYQMDEVDDFLDEIVTTLRSYDQRLRDAQDKIRALETDAVSRGGDETTISRAILVAQRSADALVAEARVEADRIKHSAKAETESLSAGRDMERSRLQAEIDAMRERVSSLRETLTTLASAIGNQVGDMEAEIGEAEGHLRPIGSAEAALVDNHVADLLLLDADDPTPMFEIADLDSSDDNDDDIEDDDDDDDESDHKPHSIDLSERDDDDDDDDEEFDKEEVVSRVSARPWERG